MVCPHTEYASQVWDPHIHEDVSQMEAFRSLLSKCVWASEVWDTMTSLPNSTLPVWKKEENLVYVHFTKNIYIVHGLIYFPTVAHKESFLNSRSSRPLNLSLHQPQTHTNAFFYSFAPWATLCTVEQSSNAIFAFFLSVINFSTSLRNFPYLYQNNCYFSTDYCFVILSPFLFSLLLFYYIPGCTLKLVYD